MKRTLEQAFMESFVSNISYIPVELRKILIPKYTLPRVVCKFCKRGNCARIKTTSNNS